ncbi:MAG: hypothetical protein LUE26_11350 [Alistipes sp.]|nr:hypothetical protein [Alistipes sp.]
MKLRISLLTIPACYCLALIVALPVVQGQGFSVGEWSKKLKQGGVSKVLQLFGYTDIYEAIENSFGIGKNDCHSFITGLLSH